LKAEAQKRLTEWKVDGLSGEFTTFGAKPVYLLDLIRIKQDGEDKGTYKVLKNTITYGTGGYRQNIKIGGING
jgi:hypothetical protein